MQLKDRPNFSMYSSFVYMKGRSGKNFLFDCHFVEIYMQRERKKIYIYGTFLPNKGGAGGLGGGSSSGVGNVGGYGSHYPQPPSLPVMEGATALDPAEMKYSCTMDFRSQGKHFSML